MSRDASGDQYARIARSLSSEHGIVATLERAAATAVEIVDRCDHAGISLVARGAATVDTISATDEVVDRAYALQTELGEGPCLQTVAEQETVYAPDLRVETRWPEWSRRASDHLEIRSVLSLQLFVGPKTFGSLDLFSDSPDAFRLDDRVSALALAAHVAVAMMAAEQRQDTESALLTRATIGRAEGMLMERLGIKEDEAFASLVRLSQAKNVKLNEIASDITTNGIRTDLFD